MKNIESFATLIRNNDGLRDAVASASSSSEVVDLARANGMDLKVEDVASALGGRTIQAMNTAELSAVAGGAPTGGGGPAPGDDGAGGSNSTNYIGCPTSTWNSCYSC